MDYLHLPVQSGSDSMLARMKRTYDRSFYLHVIDRLRDQIPDITLATDFIVGFPGETEDEFEESLSLIDEVGFDHGYVFQYSPRPGTVSDHQMDDDIPLEVKKQRNHRLLERISTSGEGRNQRFLGRQVEVIAEGTSRSNDSRWAGKARDHRTVIWDAQDDEVAGSFVVVEVDRASAATLYGQRVAGPSPRPILPNSSAL